jgi:hypothetical protein
VLSPVLAYRPASVVSRLPARCDACPLSLRDLLAATDVKLPALEADRPGVIRAGLVAAKVLHAAVGLTLPRGVDAGAWFQAVVRTADEIAAGLPIYLGAEVALEDHGAMAIERATSAVWRFVEVGLTHVTVDPGDGAPEECGRVLAEVAAPLLERGLGFACAVRLRGEPGAGRRALAMLDDLRRRGAAPDGVALRLPAPPDAEAARAQIGGLDRLAEALGGVPVLRQGPVSPPLLAVVAGSRVRGCEDGGAAARASEAEGGEGGAGARPDVRGEALSPAGDPRAVAERRVRWREQAERLLGRDEADRLEARAFVVAAEFIEALEADGSAIAVAAGLERRQAEDRA